MRPLQPRQYKGVTAKPKAARYDDMVHAPVAGKRVRRRRSRYEIAEQVCPSLRHEAHFLNCHSEFRKSVHVPAVC
jgi:hypothetical protein